MSTIDPSQGRIVTGFDPVFECNYHLMGPTLFLPPLEGRDVIELFIIYAVWPGADNDTDYRRVGQSLFIDLTKAL
jgi:hypothetical protein